MSNIEWTDRSWNPTVGCSRVSAGCENCYAERMAARGMVKAHRGLTKKTSRGPTWTGEVRLMADRLEEPLRWRKPARVFVDSMSDLFHEAVPDEFIAAVHGAMAASMEHDFQVLTKRPERARRWHEWLTDRGGLGPYIREHADELRGFFDGGVRLETYRGKVHRRPDDAWCMVFNAAACIGSGPLPNVWLGVSVEDQAAADERIPLLLQTPAAVRFLSVEPLLGPVDLGWISQPDDSRDGVIDSLRGKDWIDTGDPRSGAETLMPRFGGTTVYRHDVADGPRLSWVIVGGESGPGARPCDVGWIRSVVSQCREASVPVFVKQDSGPRPGKQGRIPDDLWVKEFPDAH